MKAWGLTQILGWGVRQCGGEGKGDGGPEADGVHAAVAEDGLGGTCSVAAFGVSVGGARVFEHLERGEVMAFVEERCCSCSADVAFRCRSRRGNIEEYKRKEFVEQHDENQQ